jgi:hypothetical protein
VKRAVVAALAFTLWLPLPGGSTSAGNTSAESTGVAGDLRVDAPASLEAAAARVRAIDRASLESDLSHAGLALPETIDILLIPEDDPRAQRTPSWVAGRAFGDRFVWIFPQRVTSYPYDSTESIVRHEVVHLALASRAGNGALPRWFHEGVAVSVGAGWGMGASVRLLLTAVDRSGIADLEELFGSARQADTTEAYLLAAALVDDLRHRHGAGLPGAIAERVAAGAPFDRAFMAETGESPDQAAERAWEGYRRWSRWLPLLTDASAVWTLILLLSFVAFFARIVRRVRQRRRWEEEEQGAD